jgi:hypothetical protein
LNDAAWGAGAIRILAVDEAVVVVVEVVVADLCPWNHAGLVAEARGIVAVDKPIAVVVDAVITDFFLPVDARRVALASTVGAVGKSVAVVVDAVAADLLASAAGSLGASLAGHITATVEQDVGPDVRGAVAVCIRGSVAIGVRGCVAQQIPRPVPGRRSEIGWTVAQVAWAIGHSKQVDASVGQGIGDAVSAAFVRAIAAAAGRRGVLGSVCRRRTGRTARLAILRG